MLEIFHKKRYIYIIDALVVVICIAGIYQLASKTGINAVLEYENDRIVVTRIKNAEQTNQLRINDTVLKVYGHHVSSLEDMEFILDGYSIGQQLDFSVERNNERISLPIALVPYNTSFYLVVLTLVALIFFSLGIFVLKKRPAGDAVALVFHWICITVSIHICTTFGRYTGLSFVPDYFLRAIFFLASALTPLLFLHFSFIFPGIKWPGYSKFLRVVYAVVFLFFGYTTLSFVNAIDPISIPAFQRFMTSYNLGRMLFALFMVLGVANFIYSYTKAVDEWERRKLRWLILGLAIGPLGFVFLWQIPQIISSVAVVPEEVILLISAVAPLTFAISIVRYHIFDIDFIFNRSTVYVFVFAFLIVIYSMVVAVTAIFIGAFTVRASIVVSAIAAVIIALLFEPARRATQRFVDKKFFRVRYNYRIAQREFSIALNQHIQVGPMVEFLINKLDTVLKPQSIALFMFADSADRYELLAGKNLQSIDSNLEEVLGKYSNYYTQPIIAIEKYLETGILFEPANKEIFKNNGIVIALPLNMQASGKHGFLLIGRKKSHTLFAFEDVDLLKTVVSQTVSAIERIHLQQNLMLQYAETQRLDELNKLKSYFVSSVSHDLQTPLTSIRMFAELLQSKTNISDKEKREYLGIIEGESQRLSRLINNVLNFSRIERGVKEYHFETIDIVKLTKGAIRLMEYQLKQNGFQLNSQLPGGEIFLIADSDAITETLTNLLDNAIKYSGDRKSITLSVQEEDSFVVIRIADKGVGISEHEQQKIFDTFYRSDDKRIQALGGAGLGLSQVRQIAVAHSGKVTVDSELGAGSTFSLFLPLGDAK